MAFRDMVSNALTPSLEMMGLSGSNSVSACNARAMHSEPAAVERACWNGTAGPNCWVIVLAVSLRITSPATIPRTPPPSFHKLSSFPTPESAHLVRNSPPQQHRCNCEQQMCVCVFFFKAEKQKNQVKSKIECPPTHSRMPCLTDHFVHRRDHAVATTWCKVKEGQSKRLRGCETQQLLPSPEPRSSTIAMQVLGESTHPGLSELTEEFRSFIGPSTSDLRRQHDETRPAPFPSKLRVRALFASAGLRQGFPVLGGHLA